MSASAVRRWAAERPWRGLSRCPAPPGPHRRDYAAVCDLAAGLARHPGAVVGFIARLDGARLRVGTSWIAWAELESACHRGDNTCWVYVGREGAPESVARMSWNRTEGDEPERLDGFTGRVIPAR